MDEFPTLEVAAAFGVAVALLRTWLLGHSLIRIPEVNERLLPHIEKRELASALALCDEAEAATYLQLVRRVVHAMRDMKPGTPPEESLEPLQHAVDSAFAVQSRRVQSGGARDLIAMVVLLGAAVYSLESALDVSRWFYGFCAAGALLLAWNVWARRRMLLEAREAAAPLVEAAARAVSTATSSELASTMPFTERMSRAPFERESRFSVVSAQATSAAGITVPTATQRSPVHDLSDKRCSACNEPLRMIADGARLVTDEGVQPLVGVLVCPACGHVSGWLAKPSKGQSN